MQIARLSLLAALCLCLSAFGQDSPMFRGNLAHTGVYNAAGVPSFNKIKWKFQTKGQVIASPAVADGVIYVAATDGNLYAIDLESGAQKWKLALGVRATASPAVDHGVVYLGTYSGRFYAVDAAAGTLKWKFQTEGERRFAGKHLHGSQPAGETMPDPFDCYLSSPAVWNGMVYFGSGDGNVYALDGASGALKWKFHTGDVVHASPAIADGALFIGSWDSYFYALDAATGKEKWRFKTGEDHDIYNQVGIQSSAAVVDGVVYFGCRDSNLYALDAATGQKKWAFNNKGSWVIASPAVQGDKVYFATSDSAMLYAADVKSGAPIFSLNFKHWPMFSSPAIAGGMLYIGSDQGKLLVIDLASQKLAWTFETDASRQNGPALTTKDGSPNYEAAFGDNFYDSMVSGVSRMMTVGSILSSPVVVNNVVYVGSADGFLYALM
ncbi:MAG TPA: PQQ-binding-like beta-propeller repeat protein [Terriglobales bacterium]|jgi:outer membrane protein assembly factor BamB|nr:PQQ-binding-like beta-propeller repeat protein [Terriglobales bacterium]